MVRFLGLTKPFLISLCCHWIVLSLVSLTFDGKDSAYGREFFFWGSIVRKTELAPVPPRSWEFSGRSKVSLSQNKNTYTSIWKKGIALDKAEAVGIPNAFILPDPLKFLGPRAVLDDADGQNGGARPVDLPAPVRVKLRYPQS